MTGLISILQRKKRLCQAYRNVFEAPEGQLVLADLLKQAGALASSHVPGDAATTSFNEGRRSLALEILAQLRWGATDLAAFAQNHDDNADGALFPQTTAPTTESDP